MNKKSGSGSGIFLMEMIVTVFFFMLCASTCILAFAKSDRMSRLASDRNRAVSAAQSVAEIWKLEGADGLMDRMDALPELSGTATGGGAAPVGAYRIYWDENWQCMEAWDAADGQETDARETDVRETDAHPDFKYTAELLEREENTGIKKLQIHIRQGKQTETAIFDLEVSRYAGNGG